MDKPHPKPCSKSKTGDISKQSPSPLHHTFSLERVGFTAQSLFALAPTEWRSRPTQLLLLTTPNQNRHATQAIAISVIRSFIAFFSSLLLYLFTIFNKLLLSVKLYFVYIFFLGGGGGGGERGAKRSNFSVLIWISIYSNWTRPGVTQTTLNAWLHLIPLLLTIEWLRNISNFYKLLPTTKDKTL